MEKLTYVKALDIAMECITDNEVVEKLGALRESIAKKNSTEKKPTANQTENAGFKNDIVAYMEVGKAYTIGDLMKSVPTLDGISNQRVSAIVKQLVDAKVLTREEIKRKAYFSLVTE